MHDDAGRYGIGETKIVGGGHAIDQDAGLVAARQRIDDGTRIRVRCLAREAVECRFVIEAARDSAHVAIAGQAVEHLIDGVARTQVEEILRRPDRRHASSDQSDPIWRF